MPSKMLKMRKGKNAGKSTAPDDVPKGKKSKNQRGIARVRSY